MSRSIMAIVFSYVPNINLILGFVFKQIFKSIIIKNQTKFLLWPSRWNWTVFKIKIILKTILRFFTFTISKYFGFKPQFHHNFNLKSQVTEQVMEVTVNKVANTALTLMIWNDASLRSGFFFCQTRLVTVPRFGF